MKANEEEEEGKENSNDDNQSRNEPPKQSPQSQDTMSITSQAGKVARVLASTENAEFLNKHYGMFDLKNVENRYIRSHDELTARDEKGNFTKHWMYLHGLWTK